MTPTFRERLRVETRPAHETLDALISTLDVSTREGFKAFCDIHLSCFTQLRDLPNLDSATAALLTRVTQALRGDLKTLGHTLSPLCVQISRTTDPTAVAYVVGGSRLGSKVLKARWAVSSDQEVQAAASYFAQPAEGPYWKAVCADLAQIAPDSVRAANVVTDTKAVFEMFVSAHRQITCETVSGNAP